MKLRIISDGTPYKTRVVNAETGEDVDGIVKVEIEITAREGVKATITVHGVDLDLDGVDVTQVNKK